MDNNHARTLEEANHELDNLENYVRKVANHWKSNMHPTTAMNLLGYVQRIRNNVNALKTNKDNGQQ